MKENRRTILLSSVFVLWITWFYQWRFEELEYLKNLTLGLVVGVNIALMFDVYKRGLFPNAEYIKTQSVDISKSGWSTKLVTPDSKLVYVIVIIIISYSVYTIVTNWN